MRWTTVHSAKESIPHGAARVRSNYRTNFSMQSLSLAVFCSRTATYSSSVQIRSVWLIKLHLNFDSHRSECFVKACCHRATRWEERAATCFRITLHSPHRLETHSLILRVALRCRRYSIHVAPVNLNSRERQGKGRPPTGRAAGTRMTHAYATCHSMNARANRSILVHLLACRLSSVRVI